MAHIKRTPFILSILVALVFSALGVSSASAALPSELRSNFPLYAANFNNNNLSVMLALSSPQSNPALWGYSGGLLGTHAGGDHVARGTGLVLALVGEEGPVIDVSDRVEPVEAAHEQRIAR